MNKLPAQKVDGLIDGMALLEELATHREPVSGLELARRLNRSPVRINRLLKTFAYLGYAYRTSSRKYAPGPALHVLAVESMAFSGLLRKAYHYLELLSKMVPTVALGVLWKEKVCYLFHKSGGAGMGSGLSPDYLYDWESSSIGHALMAARDPEQLPGELSRVLREQLEEARKNGYALVKYPDHYTLAVTIGSPPYAALAASGIKSLKEVPAVVGKLKEYAAAIEQKSSHGNGV